MDASFDKTATETIDLLEARLRRIQYAVHGGQVKEQESTASSTEEPAAKRLADLEHKLHQLASKSRVIQDLLRLRKTSTTYVLCQIIDPEQMQDIQTSSNPLAPKNCPRHWILRAYYP